MTLSQAEILANPGLLKLALMTRGVRLPAADEDDRSVGPDEGPLDVRARDATGHALFGSAADIDLVLPGDTWVAAPVRPGSPYGLSRERGAYVLSGEGGEQRVPVKISRHSAFFSQTTSTGIPFSRMGTAHGPYLALSPSNHCTFLASPGDRCHFCSVGGGLGRTHDGVPVDDIVEAVRVARGEHRVDMVYLSVGHLGEGDGGVRFLEPYVAAIKKHFDVLVAIDALPPDNDRWIDRTYAMGADAVSYNLEIWDAERFAQICPGPARAVGRRRFLDALGYATTVFQRGAVLCHLIVGLEPILSTRAGIDALTELGVLPVLPIYRPFKGRDLRELAGGELELAELAELYAHLYEAVRRARLNPHVVRDIAIMTTPLDARFFSSDGGFLAALRHRVLGSRWARRTSARLSDLRRSLRVREVGAVESG